MGCNSGLWLAVVAIAACGDATGQLMTAEPGVVYTYPIDGEVDVPLGARVVVTFSDPVDRGALTACAAAAADVSGAFCVVGPDGPVDASAEVAGDGRTLQFPRVALAPGAKYDVYVRSAVAPGARNLPAAGPLFSFTTRSTQPRAAPPVVVAVNGAPPTTPEAFRPMFESSTIRLAFSEPLDPRSVVMAPGAIELVDMASGAAVPARLFAGGIHVSIDPVDDLVAGAPYLVKVGATLVDLGGQPVMPSTIMLTPQRTGTGPPLAQRLRARQASDPGPALSRAGAARNVIAIEHALVGDQTSQVLPSVLAAELGDATALGGPIAFTIRRGQRLRASGLDIKLGGEVPSGLSTGDLMIELLTDGGGRIYRNPYQAADQRPENARAPAFADLSMDIAVYAVDPTGNAVLTQTVLGVQGAGTVVATEGVLDIEAVVAIDLDLLGVARAPANLVLELITDPEAALDPDVTAPTLVGTYPSGADGALPVDAGPELIFSEPIDLERARAGGVRLETLAGQPVASVIESHGAAIVVRPIAPLAYSMQYRVMLTDVADVAGNALAATGPVNFATPPVVATTAPMGVAAVHPGVGCALTGAAAGSPGRCAGGATGDAGYQPFALAANEPVEVRFTQAPALSSVSHGTACNAGSVRIEELDGSGACVAPVAGTLLHHDRLVSFLPDQPWQLDKHYRLTLVSGSDASCAAGELCGPSGQAASFDPLAGTTSAASGGADLAIAFTGATATGATLVVTEAAPFSDVNGSGSVEPGEPNADGNRVALRITGTTGTVIKSASFSGPDCVPETPEIENCMYVSGAVPVELLPVAHDCSLPGGDIAASCVPVALSPQTMYATSVVLKATIGTVDLPIPTGVLVLRIREPEGGPVTGYLIDDGGTPTLVVALALYLDAPDLDLKPLLDHGLHSKPLTVTLRGPLRFLPDGRIAIAVANIVDVPLGVAIIAEGLPDSSVNMLVPRGEMKLQLVSPPLRGRAP